ncbi:hypothetical protein [Sinorhizobium meliloti]|uniref:hypothetical protein n=1 Tax=Rhizobium meliloti TaxID=382 RepID=UPI0012974242|nr:hypothetical protein [Sinorhizobium meliloti]MDW9491689.1 hypothetical protein [Sinorhizobium meliloti]MQV02955.1 hypothetical protein [Sinorhizobium meliloti]
MISNPGNLLLKLSLFAESFEIRLSFVPPVPDLEGRPHLVQVGVVSGDDCKASIIDPKEDVSAWLGGNRELRFVLDEEPIVPGSAVLAEDHHIVWNRKIRLPDNPILERMRMREG